MFLGASKSLRFCVTCNAIFAPALHGFVCYVLQSLTIAPGRTVVENPSFFILKLLLVIHENTEMRSVSYFV